MSSSPKKALAALLACGLLLTSAACGTPAPKESDKVASKEEQVEIETEDKKEEPSSEQKQAEGKLDTADLEQLDTEYFDSVFLASITAQNWTNPEDLRPDSLINYYTASQYYQPDRKAESNMKIDETVPSRKLEDVVLSHFDVSVDFLRSAEGYDKENDVYALEYLGGAASAKVVKAEQNGDVLTLSFEYYSPSDDATVIRTGTLSIQITGDGYRYLSCATEAKE